MYINVAKVEEIHDYFMRKFDAIFLELWLSYSRKRFDPIRENDLFVGEPQIGSLADNIVSVFDEVLAGGVKIYDQQADGLPCPLHLSKEAYQLLRLFTSIHPNWIYCEDVR